jgi:hypothetical protein
VRAIGLAGAVLSAWCASCALFFDDPSGEGGSTAAGGGGSSSPASGTGGGGGAPPIAPGCDLDPTNNVHQVLTFAGASLTDMAIEDNRVYFVGLARGGVAGGLPSLGRGLRLFLASVNAADGTNLVVTDLGQSLGQYDDVRLSHGADPVHVSWSRRLAGRTQAGSALCAAAVDAPDLAPGPNPCPAAAMMSCTTSLTRTGEFTDVGVAVASTPVVTFRMTAVADVNCSKPMTSMTHALEGRPYLWRVAARADPVPLGAGTSAIHISVDPNATDIIQIGGQCAPGGSLPNQGSCNGAGMGPLLFRHSYDVAQQEYDMPFFLTDADSVGVDGVTFVYPSPVGHAYAILDGWYGLGWTVDGQSSTRFFGSGDSEVSVRSAEKASAVEQLVSGYLEDQIPGAIDCPASGSCGKRAFWARINGETNDIDAHETYPVLSVSAGAASWANGALRHQDCVLVGGAFVDGVLDVGGLQTGPAPADEPVLFLAWAPLSSG